MDGYGLEPLTTPAAAVERLRELVAAAEHELLVSGPERLLAEVLPAVREARERGVLVFLLTGTDETGSDCRADGLAGAATAVHAWPDDRELPVVVTVDAVRGMCAAPAAFERETDGRAGATFAHPLVAIHLFGAVIANTWTRAPEVSVADPDPLPATYRSHAAAVVNAVLHLRQGRDVTARVRCRPVGSEEAVVVDGPVCNVRQGFVEPVTNSFPGEHSLHVRHEGEVVSVGGPAAFVEDFEAVETTLEAAEE